MFDHGIYTWLAVGFVAGSVAKFLSLGWHAASWLGLIAVGMLGALFAGWAWTALSAWDSGSGIDTFAAVGGAIAALWTCGTLVPRR